MNRCKTCNKAYNYNERYDSYYCGSCNFWTEKACSDPKCFYCSKRADSPINYFGKTVVIDGPVVCNDGSKFEDYTWEEHLQFLGLNLPTEE